MIKISLSDLRTVALTRPKEYLNDVISKGNVENDVLFLSVSDYRKLIKKYSPEKLEPVQWPLLLRPMKLLAKPDDKGLGDIVERVIGPIGGEAYKTWYKTTFGHPCGCTKRKDNLNEKYPL